MISSPLLCPDKGTFPSTEEDRATSRTHGFDPAFIKKETVKIMQRYCKVHGLKKRCKMLARAKKSFANMRAKKKSRKESET